MIIYKANIVYTKQPDKFEVLERGCVAVENGRVVGISSDAQHFDSEQAQVVDYGDCLLIPAMNDMHVHAAQYRNQGMAMDLELLQWLDRYTFPEEMKFSSTAYASRVYRRFVRDLWRMGTMRCVAFASAHHESTRKLMRLFQETGMGALVGQVAMDRNCPEALCASVADVVRHTEALASEFGDPHGLVRPIVTPRFIPSCSPHMLRACGELASKHNLPVQSHLSENTDEIAFVRQLEPESLGYGDAYLRYGLLGQQPTVMAHCVWTQGEELRLLKSHDVMVAHCPTSNLNLSTAIAPVRSFLNEGVRVSLGSDISGGHDLSIFRVMVYAIQVSKVRNKHCEGEGDAFLTLPEVFWMATKCAGSFFGQVGSFEPGYEFDALVIDDQALNYDNYSILQRLERFIYLGDDRHIAHRFCRGREIPEPRLVEP